MGASYIFVGSRKGNLAVSSVALSSSNTGMASPKKIIIFLGSTRNGRQGGKVANYVREVLKTHGFQVKIFDPLEMNFPVLREALHFIRDRSTAPSWLVEADKEIQEADGFVVVSSEYNCSIPPALSNMMDHFPPKSFRHRPCSVVVYSMGEFGGIRVSTQLLPFLHDFKMIVMPYGVALPEVHKKFGADGQPNCQRFKDHIGRMVTELKWYVEAIVNGKKSAGELEYFSMF